MAQLRQDYARFEERDTEIIAIGPEPQAAFADFWESHEMPFVGIPDPEHTVPKLYGQEVKLLKMGRLPAQVIVDKSGQVRYAHYGRSMADIPRDDEILAVLDQLNRKAESE